MTLLFEVTLKIMYPKLSTYDQMDRVENHLNENSYEYKSTV